jgi:hypothetical protein
MSSRAVLILSLGLTACGSDAPPRITEPETAVVTLHYVPLPTPLPLCSPPQGNVCASLCIHGAAPINLFVYTSWEEQTRLTPCFGGYCGQLTRVPVGREVTFHLRDIDQCCRDCSPSVRETVYANGTLLTRFREFDPAQSAYGLAFEVDSRGFVTP